MRKVYRFFVILIAPFLITGCAMPIGVQIASLLADGVSMFTTDKTLTDHGLSAITDKDCALWRGIKGEDICRDTEDTFKLLADTTLPATNISMRSKAPGPDHWKKTTANIKKTNYAWAQKTDIPIEKPTNPIFSLSSHTGSSLNYIPSKTKLDLKHKTQTQILPDTPIKENSPITIFKSADLFRGKLTTVSSSHNPGRQLYFVIASYHRKAHASRFSYKYRELRPIIIKGKAHGKRVYRVSIGPITKDNYKATKQFLINEGFMDTWALTEIESNIELASLPGMPPKNP